MMDFHLHIESEKRSVRGKVCEFVQETKDIVFYLLRKVTNPNRGLNTTCQTSIGFHPSNLRFISEIWG